LIHYFVMDKRIFYLKSGINDNKLKGCILYTWSCLSGNTLGKDAVSNGCLAFIGYDESIIAGTGEIDNFIKSANCGLVHLRNGKTLGETFNAMYQEYNDIIDYYNDEIQDFWIASFFRRNRDALVFYGDKSITIERIEYNP
jgi:hypothetical protein